MKGYISKCFFLFGSLVVAIALVLTIFGLTGAQQIPGLPKLPGGIKIPSVPAWKTGFAGLDALTAAKELYRQKDKAGYPTPNIAVSGNHVVGNLKGTSVQIQLCIAKEKILSAARQRGYRFKQKFTLPNGRSWIHRDAKITERFMT